MPVVKRQIKSVDKMLEDNVMGYLRYAVFFHSATNAELADELRRRYPNASNRTINAVIDRFRESRQAAGRYNRAGKEYKVKREDLPRNPTLPQSYRYIVNMAYKNPRTGEITYRLTVIDSPKALTKEELFERGKSTTETAFRNKRDEYAGQGRSISGKTDVSMEVVTVECRTC